MGREYVGPKSELVDESLDPAFGLVQFEFGLDRCRAVALFEARIFDIELL